MFTLIKREVEDGITYFIAAAVLSAIIILILVYTMYWRESGETNVHLLILPGLLPLVLLMFGAMGVSQMYTDKNRKISSFLSTLAVTRNQILIARVVAGILAILIFMVPWIITAVILLRIFAPPLPLYMDLLAESFVTMFLLAFGCYCVGLQTGWSSGKVVPTLGGLGLACILCTLIVVKGFGFEANVLLLLFIAASLVRTWRCYMSSSI